MSGELKKQKTGNINKTEDEYDELKCKCLIDENHSLIQRFNFIVCLATFVSYIFYSMNVGFKFVCYEDGYAGELITDILLTIDFCL